MNIEATYERITRGWLEVRFYPKVIINGESWKARKFYFSKKAAVDASRSIKELLEGSKSVAGSYRLLSVVLRDYGYEQEA